MILCYIYEGMADFEITLILHRLKNTGKRQIITISEHTEAIKGQSGLTFIADRRIDEIADSSDVEALIIPGGPVNQEQDAICPLIRELIAAGKLVAAICFAPQFLGRAGILDQYRFTTSCTAEKVKQAGQADPYCWETYVEQRAVRDRNVITAKGYAFVDFALLIAEYLNLYDDDIRRYNELEQVYINAEKPE